MHIKGGIKLGNLWWRLSAQPCFSMCGLNYNGYQIEVSHIRESATLCRAIILNLVNFFHVLKKKKRGQSRCFCVCINWERERERGREREREREEHARKCPKSGFCIPWRATHGRLRFLLLDTNSILKRRLRIFASLFPERREKERRFSCLVTGTCLGGKRTTVAWSRAPFFFFLRR